MELKFKVGDRVQVKKDSGWGDVEGLVGVVKMADPAAFYPYNVSLEDVPDPHYPHNWLMKEDELEAEEI